VNGFAAGPCSTYDRHGRPPDPEALGEKPDQRFIGGPVDRTCCNANSDLVAVNPDHLCA
jgi:hypothetical protein